MTKSTKKLITTCLLSLFAITTRSQTYCVPAIIPYAPSMPGITHFVLNTINRTSAPLETPGSGFVTTGLSTTLQIGQLYSISITHTVDASICPDMNLRVWVDYNHDGQLDDVGETVLSTDHHLPGSAYTASFTIPASAITGNTRMRVTAKMSNLGGHTLPTPCNSPPDPLGYHGEMEDYTVNIVSTTGIIESHQLVSSFEVIGNPVNQNSFLRYSLSKPSDICIDAFNCLGMKVLSLFSGNVKPSLSYEVGLNSLASLGRGIYFIKLISGEEEHVQIVYVHE